MKKILYCLWEVLKWIWQLPQHIIAGFFWLYLILFECLMSTHKYDDYIIYIKDRPGYVTFGKYIFATSRCTDNSIRHEIGHTKQSLMLGPLYLFVIGIPSFLWACTHRWLFPNKKYSWFFTERWADKLGGAEAE